MQYSHPFRRIPMGRGTKLRKLREWEGMGIAHMEWERLLLMCSHLVVIFPPKSIFDLVDVEFYIYILYLYFIFIFYIYILYLYFIWYFAL